MKIFLAPDMMALHHMNSAYNFLKMVGAFLLTAAQFCDRWNNPGRINSKEKINAADNA